MLCEETGDFSEFEDFYDWHMQRWIAVETHAVWFGVNSSIYRLFLFAYSCGYTLDIQFKPKI